MLQTLIESGRIVDVVIGVLLIEIVVLIAWRLRTGRGLTAPLILANAAAGGCIALALRASLTGAPWIWVAIWLVAGGLAHATDLALRLRPAPATTDPD